MVAELRFEFNENLFLKNPIDSSLGKKIISQGASMIAELGYEDFTFKKLGIEIGSNESGIYRYFENKHRLLQYFLEYYWRLLDYQIQLGTSLLSEPKFKIIYIIDLVLPDPQNKLTLLKTDPSLEVLRKIAIREFTKAYSTIHVDEDNAKMLFKPYKELAKNIANIIESYDEQYQYPKSLATTLLQMSHNLYYFKDHLPSLTDFGGPKDSISIKNFLNQLIFNSLKKNSITEL